MDTSTASPRAASTAGAATLAAFTATTFLSALLLFSVQPMFAKMVLPLLGGSPSVWAVALCFFQAALLVGYCYAHLLIRYLPIAATGIVHLALCALAFVALPIAVPAGWNNPPEQDPYLWQLALFSVAIGLPFVAVSANAPLTQAWFAATGHKESADPYFLYAASNLGSLIALLGYPLLLEPALGVHALSSLWTLGFGVLALALAGLALMVWRTRDEGGAVGTAVPAAREWERPSVRARLGWVGLALVPSALLTAFTTHIATDVASAPLIWVVPLSLYLLTFVIVFRERALVPMRLLLVLHLAAILLALVQMSQTKHDNWFYWAFIGGAAFFLSALVAHRTLYETRPAASRLTEFYLWMSLGGVLGGLFAALIAPRLFSEVYEYPLLLALSMACRPGVLELGRDPRAEAVRLTLLALAGAVLVLVVPGALTHLHVDTGQWGATPVVTGLLAAAALAFWFYPARQLVLALLMVAAVSILPSSVHRGTADRSYFGVYRVYRSDDGQFNVLNHGTTLHGAQRIMDDDGKPLVEPTPATYYYPGSPMSSAVRVAREVAAESGRQGKFGIVGLGAGALACHAAKGEEWRFFEIDPIVEKIARSDKFTYLSHCLPDAPVIIGDARLKLAGEADGSYDLLLIDAFSSDAIPMHLLTREAIELYLSKLRPEGIGVLHLSNRYLNLEAVVAATLRERDDIKIFAVQDRTGDAGYFKIQSNIVAFSRDLAAAHRFLRIRGGRTISDDGLTPWTDDTSDIVGPFLSRMRALGIL